MVKMSFCSRTLWNMMILSFTFECIGQLLQTCCVQTESHILSSETAA